MNRFSFSFVFAALVVLGTLLTGCQNDFICKNASGEIEERTFELATLTGLDMGGIATVTLVQGDSQSVSVRTQSEVFEFLDVRAEGGNLITDLDGCWNDITLEVFVTITEPLEEISISGSATVMSEGTILAAEQLDLTVSGSGDLVMDALEATNVDTRISGSGTVTLAGTAEDHELSISGSGDFFGFDFETKNTNAAISGSGDAEVRVEGGDLDVRVSGAGDLSYKGAPGSVSVDISGSGEVNDAN